MVEETIYLPNAGELTICTIIRIVPYGAYGTLDEYDNLEGLLHISEISSRWVKNIRDHVREEQKTVLKVLRVDPIKLHIDLSLRRVNDRERRSKLLQWKRENRGKKLLAIAAEKMGMQLEKANDEIGRVLDEDFGGIYLGLEKAVEEGEKVLIKSGISANAAAVLTSIAKSKIKLPQVKISGILELKCNNPDGVLVLKKAFSKAKNLKKPKRTKIGIYLTGPPRYRIEVSAKSYKIAEKLLEKAVNEAVNTIKEAGGEGRFIRARKGA